MVIGTFDKNGTVIGTPYIIIDQENTDKSGVFMFVQARPNGAILEAGVQYGIDKPGKWGIYQRGDLQVGLPEQPHLFTKDLMQFIGEPNVPDMRVGMTTYDGDVKFGELNADH